jgi:hypothetical protein
MQAGVIGVGRGPAIERDLDDVAGGSPGQGHFHGPGFEEAVPVVETDLPARGVPDDTLHPGPAVALVGPEVAQGALDDGVVRISMGIRAGDRDGGEGNDGDQDGCQGVPVAGHRHRTCSCFLRAPGTVPQPCRL